jgi:hypothetical protein
VPFGTSSSIVRSHGPKYRVINRSLSQIENDKMTGCDVATQQELTFFIERDRPHAEQRGEITLWRERVGVETQHARFYWEVTSSSFRAFQNAIRSARGSAGARRCHRARLQVVEHHLAAATEKR